MLKKQGLIHTKHMTALTALSPRANSQNPRMKGKKGKERVWRDTAVQNHH